MKAFFKKYSQSWTLLYVLIYFPWFMWLEQRHVNYTYIYSSLDSLIPFCRFFAIPYFLWFVYVPAVVILILLKCKKEEFYKFSAMLFGGMTICLIIYTIWPNAQNLRVYFNPDQDIFTKVISGLYKTDTSTNVLPSIHVYNSIVCHFALCRTKLGKDRPYIKTLSFILMVSICLSTMFLKQHSVLDAFAAIILFAAMNAVVYHNALIKSKDLLEKPVTKYDESSTRSSR